MTGRKPADDRPEADTTRDADLDDLDAEQVEDLDADEEPEDVFGGKGDVYTSGCHTR